MSWQCDCFSVEREVAQRGGCFISTKDNVGQMQGACRRCQAVEKKKRKVLFASCRTMVVDMCQHTNGTGRGAM